MEPSGLVRVLLLLTMSAATSLGTIVHPKIEECKEIQITAKTRSICKIGRVLTNETLVGGLRGKNVLHRGFTKSINDCASIVCSDNVSTFAFVLNGSCYAVECIERCAVRPLRPKERGIGTTLFLSRKEEDYNETRCLHRRIYWSAEHKVIEDVVRSIKDSDVRPAQQSVERVNLTLEVRLVQLIDVDEIGQTLTLNVWTTLTWNNPLLRWREEEFGNVTQINVEPNLVWKPFVLLYNSADSSAGGFGSLKTRVILNNDGTNTWFASTTLKSSCKINVKYFPFDEQMCVLQFGELIQLKTKTLPRFQIIQERGIFTVSKKSLIESSVSQTDSWTQNAEELNMEYSNLNRAMQHYTTNAEWEVVSFYAKNVRTKYPCCTNPYSEVIYYLHLRRKTLYYIYTLILPCTTITALITLGFCLPPNSGERITLGVTILVTMIVYLNIASKKLPATSDNIPLLSYFYFLLVIQIAMSITATTFVLKFFFRQRFSEPMPEWLRTLLVKKLGRILCRTRFNLTVPERRCSSARRRKAVRFSNVVEVNGSQTSLSHRRVHCNGIPSPPRCQTQPLLSQDFSTTEVDPEETSNTSVSDTMSMNMRVFEVPIRFVALQGKKKTQQIIYEDLDVLTDNVSCKERQKYYILEWQYASMVVDRIFLFLFLAAIITSTCVMLLRPSVPAAA